MNKYELALVVNAKIDDEKRADVVERAKGYVTRYGGVISEVEEWGKRRLAYEIQKMREGYYYFIHFEAEPTAPAELESHMRIMDNVLRYLIVRQDENAAKVTPSAEDAITDEDAEQEEAPAEGENAEEAAPAESAETAEA